MKKLLSAFLSVVAFLLITVQVFAVNQNIVTEKKQVNGVCDQCKNRIEDAAYLKGVKHAAWNVDTHELTIKYDSTKTSSDAILKNIAKNGYDNEKYKALEEDYLKLPKCCRYKTTKKH